MKNTIIIFLLIYSKCFGTEPIIPSLACTNPAPPTGVVATYNVCYSTTTPNLVTGSCPSGSSFVLYTTATGNATYSTNTFKYAPTSVGGYTKNYWAACKTPDGCVSTRVATQVLVQAKVATPTNVSASSSSICSTTSVTLSANCGANTLNWYSNSTRTAFVGSGTGFSVTPLVTTSYYAFCYDTSTGCFSTSTTASKKVTVTTQPTAPTNIINYNACGTITTTLQATCVVGSAKWYTNSSFTGSALSSNSVKPSASTTYYVRCENGTCYSSGAQSTVTVTPKPTQPSLTAQTICSGQSTSLVGTCSTAGSVLNWYSASAATSPYLMNNTTVSPSSSRYYWARCENGTCVSTPKSVYIKVYISPVKPVIMTDKNSVCQGQIVKLSTSGCRNGTFSWLPSGGVVSGPRNKYYQVTPNATTSYTVKCTITASTCNTTSDPLTITVNPAPVGPTFGSDVNSVCAGDVVTLQMINCTGTIAFYSGTNTNLGAGTAGLLTVTVNATTNYYATCNGVKATKCGTAGLTDEILTVTAIPTIQPVITATPVSTCPVVTTQLSVTNCPAGSTVVWSDGQSGSPIIVENQTATVDYTAVCSTSGGCDGPISATYTLPLSNLTPAGAPTILDASVSVACGGDPITLTASGCSPTSSLRWFSDPAATVPAISTDPTNVAPIVTPLVSNTYYAGCLSGACIGDLDIINVSVNIKPAAPTLLVASPAIICNDGSSTLTAVCISPATLVWFSDIALTTALSSNVVSPTSNPNSYYAVCKNATCQSAFVAISVNVINNATPDPPDGLMSNTDPICVGGTTTFTADCPAAGSTLSIFSDINLTNQVAVSSAASASGATTLSTSSVSPTSTTAYYAVCKNGCNSAVQTVTVNVSTINVTVTSNAPVCKTNLAGGGYIELTSTTSDLGNTYAWSGPNSYSSAVQSPIIPYVNINQNGTYILTVTNADGCTSSISTVVSCNAPMYVTLLNFEGNSSTEGILLSWKTSLEINADFFEILKSNDAKYFEKISKLNAFGTSSTINQYSFTDNFPNSGNNYYRLKSVDLDGTFQLSNIISVNGKTSEKLVPYPNPIVDNYLKLNTQKEIKSVFLIDNNGIISELNFNVLNKHIEISLPNLKAGVHFIKTIDYKNNYEVFKIVK